jgi:HlyD family secretion protein
VQLEYQEADLKLKRINVELQKLTIRSSIPGLVNYTINYHTGTKVQVGDSVHSRWPLIFLPNMNSVQIDIYVYDSDIPLLVGQESAEVVFDAAPGQIFHGQLTYLPKVAKPREPGSSLKAFKAEVLLGKVDSAFMKPGMTARVRIPVVRKDVLVVPRTALVLGPGGSTSVRTPSGPVEVTALDANESYVLVEGNIEAGQELLPPDTGGRINAGSEIAWLPTERQDFVFSVNGNGTLKAKRARLIGPPNLRRMHNYKIAQLIPEGTNVTEGDLLVRFDPREIEERLREERADLEKVDEELRKTKASEELKLKDLEIELEDAYVQREKAQNKMRQQRAFGSILEAREAEYEAELAEKRVDSLEKKRVFVGRHVDLQIKTIDDRRRLHQHRIEENEVALEAMTVKAPISGVVIYETDWRNDKKRVGSEVYRSESVISLPDLTTLQVDGEIAEVDAGKVEIGQTVNITFDALPNRAFTGTLQHISSIFRRASRDQPVKVLEVEVKLDALDIAVMRPGMVARLDVVVDRFSDVLAVPLSVIRVRDGQSFVRVRGPNGPEERLVEVGRDNGVLAVIESGLQAGEEVADRSADSES